jgi:hypothetical protein
MIQESASCQHLRKRVRVVTCSYPASKQIALPEEFISLSLELHYYTSAEQRSPPQNRGDKFGHGSNGLPFPDPAVEALHACQRTIVEPDERGMEAAASPPHFMNSLTG